MDARYSDIKEKSIEIPNYIYGEERFGNPEQTRTIPDVKGTPVLEIHDANKWGLKAAAETAATTHDAMNAVSIHEISHVLETAMDIYFSDSSKFKTICRVTGSPYSHVDQSTGMVKNWCRNILSYYENSFGRDNSQDVHIAGSAPVVVILPGNSDQEVIFILAQTLMTKNPAVVRPSTTGAGSFVVYEFIRALNAAIDTIGRPELEVLRSAVSLVNTRDRDFLDSLCHNGWNYIFFGDASSVITIETAIRKKCFPRRTIGYGTGLSTTVLLDDRDIDNRLDQIMDAVTTNRGNDCMSTDIIYIHEPIYETAIELLLHKAKQYLPGDPLAKNSIGIIESHNSDFIKGELIKRGRLNHLDLNREDNLDLIHPSVIPINEFETAIEYPGPVVSVRSFKGTGQLADLIKKDLMFNQMTKSLVTSVYSTSETTFKEVVPALQAHTIKWNKPTHDFSFSIPHQGISLLRELADIAYLDG